MMINTTYHNNKAQFKVVPPNNRSRPAYGRTMVDVAVEKDAPKMVQVHPRLVSNFAFLTQR